MYVRFVLTILVTTAVGCFPQSRNANTAEPETPSIKPPKDSRLGPNDWPKFEGGWYELPVWADELPFELKDRIQIAREQNREQLYLQALCSIEPTCLMHFPQVRQADSATRQKQIESIDDRVYAASVFLVDRFDNDDYVLRFTDEDTQSARRLLKPFESAFAKLHEAKGRTDCFFHSDWSFLSIEPRVAAGSSAARLLALRCNSAIGTPQSIQCLEHTLRLKRDLTSLSDYAAQMVGGAMEGQAFRNMVRPILADEDVTERQAEEVVQLLWEHQKELRRQDSFLESTKREVLNFRHLLHLLATNSYATAERAESLDLEPDVPISALLTRELVVYNWYRINTSELKAELERIARTNDEFRPAWKKFRGEVSDEDFADGASILLGMYLLFQLDSMKQSDYEDEIALLDARYADVERSCRIPFPESTLRLKKLEQRWTLGNTPKSSKLLRWFLPANRLAVLRRNASLRRNAYLCLAAARCWQLKHGELPENLAKALANVDINEIPIDVHSGDGLKMAVIDEQVHVYSVGPDGDDDMARVRYDPWSVTEADDTTGVDGDIVYTLTR